MRIGIDLGGTKIEGVVLDGDGTVVARRRIDSPRDDYGATLDAVCVLAAELEGEAGAAVPGGAPGDWPVGIGTPGSWRPAAGCMHGCNSTWLNGRPLLTDLEARFGPRVRIANDADCFALSEAVDGAAAGAGSVFGVILGTGVGGGIVVDGSLLRGANGIAGEWGHVPLPYLRAAPGQPPGLAALEARLGDRACWCGRGNCIETFLSGPGLATTSVALGGPADTRALVRRAADDPSARAIVDLYAHMLARSLAMVINLIDPQVVVLGGGLSSVRALYPGVRRWWNDTVFSDDAVSTWIVPPMHGDASGVRGAAWLWPASAAPRRDARPCL